MELAFYYPFQSTPPNNVKGGKGNAGSERTARPMPLDIDGDGTAEALVMPVFLKRSDVVKEQEMELKESEKNKRKSKHDANNVAVDEPSLEGWNEDGTWGLRILNLKPLRDAYDENKQMAGPFAPRTLFLSPLFPYASKNAAATSGDIDEHATTVVERRRRATSSSPGTCVSSLMFVFTSIEWRKPGY